MSVDTSPGERLLKLKVAAQGFNQNNAKYGWFRADGLDCVIGYSVSADSGKKIQKGEEIECTIKFTDKDGKLNAWMSCLGEKKQGGGFGKGASRNPEETHWESLSRIIAAAVSVPGDSLDMMHRRCEFGVAAYRRATCGESSPTQEAPSGATTPAKQLAKEFNLSLESLTILARLNATIPQLRELFGFIQGAMGSDVDSWVKSRPNAKSVEDLKT